ncbi:histidine phosphatase family protein [Mycolicibacterium bacteremicum]|uniref:Histidine phosphatase family protein n=1 Tax=Mycolicibacterium bacteremicum TaxID=564198 RepID=A0A1W9Z3T2_MYCBA|nr:histidine phosphatase family protein [Mycolicibacterium bacteremicum]MCV7431700.1 histidine phosphatase family protein [Mycolicibacterium bacteremicum]ORA06822.1 histidine phosphatase family protein [Mycolicibacterium bacteremicum]
MSVRGIAGALLIASAVLTAPTAAAEPDITVTLVRHAQSAGNASGLIDTSTPGPSITPSGREQADAVTVLLRGKGTVFDGIYASTMIRTQQTAQPMVDALGEAPTVLPGLREIEAGVYEGEPEIAAGSTYFQAPMQWLRGDRTARIPGSVDGNEFDARFDQAMQTIYDSGDRNAVAYSHGAAIMTWVAMNVRGVDPAALASDPLRNTGYFVLRGNPIDGWTLITENNAAR